jgi:NADPH:quinone reductase-like Zn-dependent oxidoreductase
MRAIVITHRPEIGGLSELIQLADVPMPEPKSREVLVKVQASSINIDDLHVAEGTFFGGLPIGPKPSSAKPVIPGTDLSGIVVRIGPKITRFQVGDKVFGIHPPTKRTGPWAEYCCTHEDYLIPRPGYLTPQEGAACAQAGLVASSTIVQKDRLEENQKCLIVGASGGIGTLAIQMAKQRGAYVVAVCSEKNASLVKSLGADEVIDYTAISFVEALKNKTKLDLVVDLVGGKDIEMGAMKVLNKRGIFVTVVGPVQYIGDTYLGRIGLVKLFAYLGWRILSSLFIGPKYQLVGSSKAVFLPFQKFLDTNIIKPIIDRELALTEEEMRDAISYMATHRARGKVVINMDTNKGFSKY